MGGTSGRNKDGGLGGAPPDTLLPRAPGGRLHTEADRALDETLEAAGLTAADVVVGDVTTAAADVGGGGAAGTGTSGGAEGGTAPPGEGSEGGSSTGGKDGHNSGVPGGTEPYEEPGWFESLVGGILDVFQGVLDVIGLIPVLGELCDGLNGLIYLVRGDAVSAGLSFAAMVPVAGAAATGAKWTKKVVSAAKKGDNAADGVKAATRGADAASLTRRTADDVVESGASQGSLLAPEGAALRPYGGKGGGHHVPAKKAFEGACGYNYNEALAIPNAELAQLGVKHSKITGAQASIDRKFSKTRADLGWDDIARIETKSLSAGGMDADMTGATVQRAIQSLKDAGVAGPTKIPWGGR